MIEATDTQRLIDAGWREHARSGFMGLVGPLWSRREADRYVFGVLVTREHANPAGMIHGGMIASLLDQSVSTAAWEATVRQPCVTAQLDTHFVVAVLAFGVCEKWQVNSGTVSSESRRALQGGSGRRGFFSAASGNAHGAQFCASCWSAVGKECADWELIVTGLFLADCYPTRPAVVDPKPSHGPRRLQRPL
ncbi:hypothetical protein PUN4_510056 [Paraburkholderia unamae]|uniref:PaaI family thioesterase n=1 Tax=Paraburkholderia unamae TaxID=219649 RepID=UPI001CB2E855|nr:PaaI family thioesterase [Paraburkholderia unamae]CAG9266236.1 hypothetical protein PUN4_510056 [Paraburkholderia unamae]